jgi:ABC-2 type transport system permease protein
MRLLAYADAAVAVAKRDINVFRSYRMRFISQAIAPFFTVALFYYISRLVRVGPFRTHDAYFEFVVVGLVILAILYSSFTTVPSRVRQELVAGTFEKCVVSPFGAVASVVCLGFFPFVMATATGILTLAFSAIVFHLSLEWSTLPLALPLAFLGWLAFMPLALMAAGLIIAVKQAESGLGYIATGFTFIAGFLFPVALLPGWIQWTSKVQPFTPTLELLRHVLVGAPLTESPGLILLKLLGFIAVLTPLSLWALSSGIRYGQRRGTIIEY